MALYCHTRNIIGKYGGMCVKYKLKKIFNNSLTHLHIHI